MLTVRLTTYPAESVTFYNTLETATFGRSYYVNKLAFFKDVLYGQ